MLDLTVLPAYVAMILLFLGPPGPDMIYMVAVGLEGGRKSAVKAILGIGTGMSVYAVAVIVGIAEIARSYPAALHIVRLLGAMYLLWLAYQTMRNARRETDPQTDIIAGRWYLRGVVISLTNPKIILFFMAVMPQFIGSADDLALQMAMLGAINVLMEVVLYGGIGILAGTFHARFMGAAKATVVLNYVAATVYVILAGTIFAGIIKG